MNYEEFLEAKRFTPIVSGLTTIPPLNPSMFPHQRDVCSWALRLGRAAAFLGTGMGKTLIEEEWARVVSEHTGMPVLILAPLAVAYQMVTEGTKFGIEVKYCKDSSTIGDSRIIVTNYERMENFEPSDFAGVVLDECFAKGTKIDTPGGKKNIEDIRVGDDILNCVGIDTVQDIHRREVPYAALVKIGGTSFIASPNHPTFTQRGWVGAQHLRPGDYALGTGAAVSLVRDSVCSKVSRSVRPEVLRDILLSEMADEPTGATCEGSQSNGGGEARSEKVCMVGVGNSASDSGTQAHNRVESYQISGYAAQDFHPIESHEAQTFRTWREWSGDDYRAVDDDGCSWLRMDSGICRVSGSTKSRLSIALQTRLRESEAEIRNRGGWSLAQHGIPQTGGQKEGVHAEFVRVDSVEILEQGDSRLEQLRDADGKLYFYDLGATRHPSYSVAGCLVHNSSILKSFDGATRSALIDAFKDTPYRLAATATPAPNDHMELGNHAEFLGVMTATEMLSMFFTHDGGETQKWRLKGHARAEFWKWVCSWAVNIRKPSDVGYDDGPFILPELVYHEHIVDVDTPSEGMLFAMPAETLSERLAARRSTVDDRVAEVKAIVDDDPGATWLIWTNLNRESEAVVKAIGGVELTGSNTPEYKAETSLRFAQGEIGRLTSKSSILGFGVNYQICSHMIFAGVNDSWEQFFQAIRRAWRFGQQNTVHVHIIAASTEGNVLENLKRKERESEQMAEEMQENMQDLTRMNLVGTVRSESAYEREVKTSDNWTMHLADCVDLARELTDNSVHYSIYSPPFASLYTYSNSERDLGNSKDHDEFWHHYRFLIKEQYRALMPGRLVSIHCMNLPTSKVRDGHIGLRDFRGEIIRAFEEVGFIYHSEVCIWKDPVTAMQRTKALGLLHKQIRKDSTMSRQGVPDYLVTMRKPGDNPERCAHTSEQFPVQLWQQYASPIWMDINPSDTLQYRSAREHNDERHICPLQLEVIRRAVKLWTNPGDVVWSPFAGIGSEGFVALEMGRKFLGSELKKSYYNQACRNLDRALASNAGLFAEQEDGTEEDQDTEDEGPFKMNSVDGPDEEENAAFHALPNSNW